MTHLGSSATDCSPDPLLLERPLWLERELLCARVATARDRELRDDEECIRRYRIDRVPRQTIGFRFRIVPRGIRGNWNTSSH
jgi:hypothetical protein